MKDIKVKDIADLISQAEIKPRASARTAGLQTNDRFQGTGERVFVSELKNKLHEKDTVREKEKIADNNTPAPVRENDRADQPSAENEVAKANRAASASSAESAVPADKLEALEKAVKAKAQEIKTLLEKLGLNVTLEQILSPDFIKKAGAVLTQFLDTLKTEGADQLQLAASLVDIEKALSVKLNMKPEEIPDLLKTLQQDLSDLKMLLDLKDFAAKTTSASENGNVAVAESMQTQTDTPSAQAETGTEGAQSPAVENKEAAAVTPETTGTVPTDGTPQTQTPVTDAVATDAPVVLGTGPVPGKQKKAVAAGAGSGDAAPVEAAAEKINKEVKKVLAEIAAQVPAAENAKNKAAAAETKGEVPVAAPIVVTENKKKEAGDAVQPETGKPSAAADAAKTDTEIKSVKSLFETPAKEDNKETVKQEIPKDQAQPQDGGSQSKTESQDKNPLIKTLVDIKEALVHAVMQPKAEVPPANNAAASKAQHLSYLYNEKAVPEKAVLHQIVTKFQLLTGQHGSEIRVQLKPDHLGSIKMSIEVSHDVVFTRMEVENEKVKQIIENNVQTLKNALEESGIRVEKFEVTVNQGRDDFYKRELSDNGRRVRGMLRAQTGRGYGGGEAMALDPVAETGRRYGYNTVEYVG